MGQGELPGIQPTATITEMQSQLSIIESLATNQIRARRAALFAFAIPRHVRRLLRAKGARWAIQLADDIAQDFLMAPSGLSAAAAGYVTKWRAAQRLVPPGQVIWRAYLKTCIRHYVHRWMNTEFRQRRFELQLGEDWDPVDGTNQLDQVLSRLDAADREASSVDDAVVHRANLSPWSLSLKFQGASAQARRDAVIFRVYVERIKTAPFILRLEGVSIERAEPLWNQRREKYGTGYHYLANRFDLTERALQTVISRAGSAYVDWLRESTGDTDLAAEVSRLCGIICGLDPSALSPDTIVAIGAEPLAQLYHRIVPAKSCIIRELARFVG